jgi:hypothetical protein
VLPVVYRFSFALYARWKARPGRRDLSESDAV